MRGPRGKPHGFSDKSLNQELRATAKQELAVSTGPHRAESRTGWGWRRGQREGWRKADGIRTEAESARTTQAGLTERVGGTLSGEKARELEKGLLVQCDELSTKQAPRGGR